MNVSTLLPEHIEKKYPELNATHVGVLMGLLPVGYVAASPLVGGYLEYVGRKNMVAFGIFMMVVATLIFGFAS